MADLEQRLRALGADAFPPPPDVRAAVASRIAAAGAGAAPDPSAGRARARGRGATGRWRAAERLGGMSPRARRRALAVALALVLVPTAAVAAVPGARHAVLDLLGLAHVRVERVPRLPDLAALDRTDLGRNVASPAAAGRLAGVRVTVPSLLGTPDAVYVSGGGVVTLAYEPRPGLPPDRASGLGLLVTELQAYELPKYVAKMAGPGTRVEAVRVDGARGVFLSGAPHELLIEQRRGVIRPLPPRLAGDTLAFERDGLVIRLEGRFDRPRALALARSLRADG